MFQRYKERKLQKDKMREERLLRLINSSSNRKLIWILVSRFVVAVLLVVGFVLLWGYVDGRLSS